MKWVRTVRSTGGIWPAQNTVCKDSAQRKCTAACYSHSIPLVKPVKEESDRMEPNGMIDKVSEVIGIVCSHGGGTKEEQKSMDLFGSQEQQKQ